MQTDDIDLDEFEQLILTRQKALVELSQSSSEGTSAVELDQTKVGRLSRMDALQMQQMNLESERRRQREQQGLKSALNRIEDDSFGKCLECGDFINPQRLRIDLTAQYCISCAEKRERHS